MCFVAAGIKHVDLFYRDGGNPSEAILQRFLKICEDTKARTRALVAVLGVCIKYIDLCMHKVYSFMYNEEEVRGRGDELASPFYLLFLLDAVTYGVIFCGVILSPANL